LGSLRFAHASNHASNHPQTGPALLFGNGFHELREFATLSSRSRFFQQCRNWRFQLRTGCGTGLQ
jgi:hypothetical protein